MDHQRAAGFALHETLAVVQPGIVAAHVTTADQHQRGSRRLERARRTIQVVEVGVRCIWMRRSDVPSRRTSPCSSGPRPMPCGAARSRFRLRPRGLRSGASSCCAWARTPAAGPSAQRPAILLPIDACPEHPVEQPVRAQPARDAAFRRSHASLHARLRPQPQRELGEDLVIVQRAGRPLEERRRILDDVAHREAGKRDVVVAVLERTRGRQDQVGVPRGLVEVGITDTMNSRLSSARSSCRPFGVESTGLPAKLISARTCPGPR